MTDFPDLGPATERVAGIAAAIPDERLDAPTPCTGTPGLVLHGWDLARAVGLDYRPDPAEVEACLGFVGPTASPEGVPGLFGPIVAVAPDAPSFDRLLGLSGRDPRWVP
jgi:hypothetical protein